MVDNHDKVGWKMIQPKQVVSKEKIPFILLKKKTRNKGLDVTVKRCDHTNPPLSITEGAQETSNLPSTVLSRGSHHS